MPPEEAPATPPGEAQPKEEVERKEKKKPLVVFKVMLDQDGVQRSAERNKLRPFGGGGFFSRVRSEDIEVASAALYYTPYVKQIAGYKIDYYRKNYYTVPIDGSVSEVIILGNTIKPEAGRPTRETPRGPIPIPFGPAPGPSPESTIKLEADERIIRELSATIVVDRFGKEVALSTIPTTSQEENPEEVIAKAGDKVFQPVGLEGYATNLLKLKVAQRPAEAVRINSETFAVTETTVNYVPVYNVLLRNKKTGDTKTLLINAITSEVGEV